MFTQTIRTGLLLGFFAIIGTSCGNEATVTAQSANGSDLESGDPSAIPGILGGEVADTSTNPEASLEASTAEVTKDGETVSDDSGMVEGEILTARQIDTFTFEVKDDQTIYLVETGGCSIVGGESLGYEFKGAASALGDFADVDDKIECDQISSVRTESSGPVQLVISSETGLYGDKRATGMYSFQIVIVSDPSPVPLTFDEVVGPDSPQVGAGRIESLGQTDLYTFPVVEATVYEVVGQGGCKVENGDRFVFDIEGVSQDWIDGPAYFGEQSADGDCNETYRFEATESGTARIEISGEDANTTGSYSFVVQQMTSTQ